MFKAIKAVFTELFSTRNYKEDIKGLFSAGEREHWIEYETDDPSFETKHNIKVTGLTMADMQRRLEQKGVQVSLARIQTIITELRQAGILRSGYTLKGSPVRIYTRGANY